MTKQYNLMYNVGKVKYVINYHDGVNTHKDGSPFFGIHCFSNKKLFQKKCRELDKEGYICKN